MTESDIQATEAARTLQHLYGIADLIAERMRKLPRREADELLEEQLVKLALLSKQQERRSDVPALTSAIGYLVSAVIRTRVAIQLGLSGVM